MTSAARQPNRQRGFTLVELIVAVSIVGLLTAIALPTYRTYTMRANRAVAKAALVDLAARQETYFVDRKAYASSLSDINANGFLSRDSTMTSAQGNTTIYSQHGRSQYVDLSGNGLGRQHQLYADRHTGGQPGVRQLRLAVHDVDRHTTDVGEHAGRLLVALTGSRQMWLSPRCRWMSRCWRCGPTWLDAEPAAAKTRCARRGPAARVPSTADRRAA